MNPHPPLHRSTGFTFIELMVVVLVLAIVAAIAVPRLGNAAPTRLRAAADLIVADLGFAQVESLSHSEDPRVFVVDLGNETYAIAAASDTATPITNPVTKQPYLTAFGQGRAGGLEGVTLNSVDFNGDDELQFGLYGELDQATPATITIGCQSVSLTITIDPTTGEATVGDFN